jgi:hypothetical protein
MRSPAGGLLSHVKSQCSARIDSGAERLAERPGLGLGPGVQSSAANRSLPSVTSLLIDFHDGDGPVLSTASHVAVLVVHAGTVDEGEADVTLDIRVATQRGDNMPHEVALELASGRLYVGDADDSDEVALEQGRWLLQFDVDDPAEAQRVRLVVSPL